MAHKTVFRVAPVHRSELAAMSNHQARTHAVDDVNVHPERTSRNDVLIGSGDPRADTEALINQYKNGKNIKDPVVAAEFILTANKEYFDTEFAGWREDPLKLKEWVKAQKAFIKNNEAHIGKAVSAILHLDEEAPHIHLVTVPLSETRVKNRYIDRIETRISYTKLFGDGKADISEARRTGTTAEKTKLGRLQTLYSDSMQRSGLNLERGVSNTGKKHISPAEFKKIIAQVLHEAPDLSTLKTKAATISNLLWHGNEADIVKESVKDKQTIETLKVEVRNMNEQNKTLERNLEITAKNLSATTNENNILREQMKEYRGITESELIKNKFATPDEIDAFKAQSGRKKFNALDFTCYKFECDIKTAVVTMSETFPYEAVGETAADKKFTDIRAEARKQAETDKAIVIEHMSNIENNVEAIIPSKNRSTATKAKELSIKKQTDAIGAKFYRVTLMHNNPDKLTFNLGKGKGADGSEKFYTPDELIGLIPTLSYRNAHGYNVLITPMPEDNHRYVLVDDVIAENLSKAKWLSPCLIVKTSPQSHQALYKVEGEAEAARAVFHAKNVEFGDKKITGLIHPMRLAGFTNRKPKHERNGLYPFVEIIEATGKESPELTRFATAIHTEVKKMQENIPTIQLNKTSKSYHPEGKVKGLKELAIWYEKQIRYWGVDADFSKIDRQLCVNMSEIGLTEDETKTLLVKVSPNIKIRHPDIDHYLKGKVNGLNFAKPEVKTHSHGQGMGLG